MFAQFFAHVVFKDELQLLSETYSIYVMQFMEFCNCKDSFHCPGGIVLLLSPSHLEVLVTVGVTMVGVLVAVMVSVSLTGELVG